VIHHYTDDTDSDVFQDKDDLAEFDAMLDKAKQAAKQKPTQ
jgi:hypothetical protein